MGIMNRKSVSVKSAYERVFEQCMQKLRTDKLLICIGDKCKMNKHNRYVKNKIFSSTFLKMFTVFIGCILMVEIILFANYCLNDYQELLEQNRKKNSEVIKNVVDYLQTLVTDEIIMNATIPDTTWSVMLGAETEAFDEKITYDRLNQLTEDFLFFISTGSVLDSRSVFFIKKQIMVTRSYFGSINYFLGKNGIPINYQEEVLEQISSANKLKKIDCFDENGTNMLDNKIMLVAPFSDRKYGNEYTVTLIDLEKLEKVILQMISDSICEVRIYDCDTNEIFLRIKEGEEPVEKNLRSERVQIIGINWAVEFKVNDVVLSISEMFQKNLIIYIAVIILTIIIAVCLTIFMYVPIKKIARKLPEPAVGKNLYQSIESSVDKIVLELEESQRQDLLHQLLIGYFENKSEEDTKNFPVKDNTWVKVIIIKNQKKLQDIKMYEELEHFRCLMVGTGIICMMMQSIRGNFVLLLGHESYEELKKVSVESVGFQTVKKTEIFEGRMEKSFIGVSKSYQSAIEKMDFMNGIIQPRYYFPTDWKVQWNLALRQGKNNVVEEIMQEVFYENNRRLEKGELEKDDFYHLFQRIFEDIRICIREIGMDESNLGIEKFYLTIHSVRGNETHTEKNELLHIEKELILLGKELSGKIIKRMEFNTSYNRGIIEYITENLSNPELSVAYMEDVFNISANTINKTVKYYTGKTFLPYLTHCRMELAKELLLQDIKIADVAIQVGYENEYSFRRVFQRHCGIKVQDFNKR